MVDLAASDQLFIQHPTSTRPARPMSKSSDVVPRRIKSPEENAVRTRLVRRSNENIPGVLERSRVHIQLYDRLKFGKLDRTHFTHLEDAESGRIERGQFLCGTAHEQTTLHHVDDRKNATCRRCRQIGQRLLREGFQIFLLSENQWGALHRKAEDRLLRNTIRDVPNLDKLFLHMQEGTTTERLIDFCHSINATVSFQPDSIIIESDNKEVVGDTFVEAVFAIADALEVEPPTAGSSNFTQVF